jgi:hypothetical protein
MQSGPKMMPALGLRSTDSLHMDPNARDPNYHASLQQAIAGLWGSDAREEQEDAETEEGKSNI